MVKFHVFVACVQFWMAMHLLSKMTEEQTLIMYSGHPLGLFPSHPEAPRAIITNGMVCLSVCLSVFFLCLPVSTYCSRQNYT